MSTFSLISSAHQRLLRHLPEKDNLDYSEEQIRLALNLFLQPAVKPGNPGAKLEPRRISRRMLWIWQCPTMLMSYSWVFFLAGYSLHVLTPVFGPLEAEVSSKVCQAGIQTRWIVIAHSDTDCYCHRVRLRSGRPQFCLLCGGMPAPSSERHWSLTGTLGLIIFSAAFASSSTSPAFRATVRSSLLPRLFGVGHTFPMMSLLP
jgi:hypothetical protein